MTGDLHCHTCYSDGSMTPEGLVEYAGRIGLQYLAVTDHDTMDGIAGACVQAEGGRVTIIPGIEVSSFDYKHGKKVHILCYRPLKTAGLLEFCANTLTRRNSASLEMIEKAAEKYPVDERAVRHYCRGRAIYKQHISMALMDMGFSQSVFGELYRELFSSKGGWALVETRLPDTHEAFEMAKESGGVVVLAHPGVYGNFDIIEELCGMGLDGIEVHHPRQSEADCRRAAEAAEAHSLLATGGSDFHGMNSSGVYPLGAKTIDGSPLQAFLERVGL